MRAVRTAAREAGIGTGVMVTGAPVLVASLGAEIRRELPRLGVVALALVALAFFVSHRVRGWRRFAPLALGLAATAVVLGGFGWLGTPLSIGMLAFLPVMLGVGTNLPIQAAHPARRRVLLAAAVAGAAAFAALGLSPLPFVRHLGLALAAGVLVSAALALPSMRSSVGGVGTDERMSGWGRGRHLGLAAGVMVAAVGWVLLPGLPVEARRGLPALATPAGRSGCSAPPVRWRCGSPPPTSPPPRCWPGSGRPMRPWWSASETGCAPSSRRGGCCRGWVRTRRPPRSTPPSTSCPATSSGPACGATGRKRWPATGCASAISTTSPIWSGGRRGSTPGPGPWPPPPPPAGFAALAISRLEVLAEFGLVLAGSILLALLAARLLTAPVVSRLPGDEAPFPSATPTRRGRTMIMVLRLAAQQGP